MKQLLITFIFQFFFNIFIFFLFKVKLKLLYHEIMTDFLLRFIDHYLVQCDLDHVKR
jgi:hypothetical protein